MSSPPPAVGVRLPWSALPPRLLALLEERLGSPIVSVISPVGGFSPGVVARLRTADGERAFVKATPPGPNPDAPGIYRREIGIVSAMPPNAPVPRLLWSHDEGESGWVMLVLEDIEGQMPAQPWREDELIRVVDALTDLAATLTPSPVEAPSAGDRIAQSISGWRLARDELPEGLDEWSVRHIDALVELEGRALSAVEGDTLLHLDIRADNILLTQDRVYIVDWPHACIGASWVDVIFFAPSVTMQGGPEPEKLITLFPSIHAADPDSITAALAAIAGFFTRNALQPDPPGLPTLRAFQAAQGLVARRWLVWRTGWE